MKCSMLPHPYYSCNHVQSNPVLSVAEGVEGERSFEREKNAQSESKAYKKRSKGRLENKSYRPSNIHWERENH